jgi:hypothetical protein
MQFHHTSTRVKDGRSTNPRAPKQPSEGKALQDAKPFGHVRVLSRLLPSLGSTLLQAKPVAACPASTSLRCDWPNVSKPLQSHHGWSPFRPLLPVILVGTSNT